MFWYLMTHDRPKERWASWASKFIVSIFLLVLGGMANQFWNIPVQQQHQDDRLDVVEKRLAAIDHHLEYNDQRLDTFNTQHAEIKSEIIQLRKYHEGRPKR